MTQRLRILPDFIIIGAQRCGTTSLYGYLDAHPDVAPASVKEIHYFDLHFRRGASWYRSFFPLMIHRHYAARRRRRPFATGEASPYYIFHPRAAERVFATVPSAKLILMLRNPVDRAYSQYCHEVREGFEDAPTFSEALDREAQRLEGERERLLAEDGYVSYSHLHHSYRARGVYVDQIRTWRRFFPRERILILKSEEFFLEPRAVLERVQVFLGLPERRLERDEHRNRIDYPEMDSGVRGRLAEYFRPHNQELYRYLDMDFGWDR
jgi:hypothetical protein